MKDILNLLQKLNFSKTEASVYVELLKNPNLNGYQIAKNLNMSRSSIYSSLENLYRKGIVFSLPGNSQMYKAENPDTLINRMKKEFNKNAESLEVKLHNIKKCNSEERYINIQGYNNIVSKAKEILLTATKEVYINTDFDLQTFSKEFIELNKNNVRIIIFSFSNLNTKNLPVEFYTHCDPSCLGKETRIMLVVDCKKTLIADRSPHSSEFLGTFTDNLLLSSIVSEHIHNDIYLLKLKNKHKKDLVTKDIKINTILENR